MLPKGIIALVGLLAIRLCAANVAPKVQSADNIGIFDLKTIRSVPLDVEILSKTKQDDITIEQVRFTSVPGVRIYAILTYKESMKGAPGYVVVDRFKARTHVDVVKNGYFGVSISPPTGNQDPKKMDTVGGPAYHEPFSINDNFLDDKNQSYIYHYVVALLRGMDYLATRPEIDLSKTVVSGYSWPGSPVLLLHALDDRELAFFTHHGLGYFVPETGPALGVPVPLTRKQYDMYCPAAYAQYGTKPVYIGVALDDMYTKLDAVMEAYPKYKGQKVFAYAPNRSHEMTGRGEFLQGNNAWLTYWLGYDNQKPSKIGEGTIKNAGGKITYECSVSSSVPLTHAECLVSYGKPGNWMGRTWHRFVMTRQGDTLQCEIPVYDSSVPFYAIGQIETQKFGDIGNGPQFIRPSTLGITAANTPYPSTIFDPALKDDLYIRTGGIEWSTDGPTAAGSAIISLEEFTPDNCVIFQNVDAELWKGKTSLSIWMKGDGETGPVTAYLVHTPNWFMEFDKKDNYTAVELVGATSKFSKGWVEYSIPLSKIPNLNQVATMFLYTQKKRKLQLGPMVLK